MKKLFPPICDLFVGNEPISNHSIARISHLVCGWKIVDIGTLATKYNRTVVSRITFSINKSCLMKSVQSNPVSSKTSLTAQFNGSSSWLTFPLGNPQLDFA